MKKYAILNLWFTLWLIASSHSSQEIHSILKVIQIGPPKVGKTAVLERFSADEFRKEYRYTIGTDFSKKKVVVDNKNVILQDNKSSSILQHEETEL